MNLGCKASSDGHDIVYFILKDKGEVHICVACYAQTFGDYVRFSERKSLAETVIKARIKKLENDKLQNKKSPQ